MRISRDAKALEREWQYD